MSQKSKVTENEAKKITTCKNFFFVCNFIGKVITNKLFFSNYKLNFLTYSPISQKLKMSETSKVTEMEPYMTQKSFKKRPQLFLKVRSYG